MKIIILAFIYIISSLTIAFGQTSLNNTLNVKLYPIQILKINKPTINLSKDLDEMVQINIYSTSGYDISIYSMDNGESINPLPINSTHYKVLYNEIKKRFNSKKSKNNIYNNTAINNNSSTNNSTHLIYSIEVI